MLKKEEKVIIRTALMEYRNLLFKTLTKKRLALPR